jgi:hypothetical protein
LLVSQLLTLYTTPVIYIYLDQLGGLLGRLRRGKQSRPQISGAPHPAE